MSRYLKYNSNLKYAAKPASSKWSNEKRSAVIGTEINSRADFHLKDESLYSIVSHYMTSNKNDPVLARNALVRYMNWSKERFDKITMKKLQDVLHYFDFVLIKPTPQEPPYLPIWQHFEKLLKEHDWHYEYSEKGVSYFNKMAANEAKLNVMYKNLLKKDEEKAKALWSKYAIKKQDKIVTKDVTDEIKSSTTDVKDFYEKQIKNLQNEINKIKVFPIGNSKSFIPNLEDKINKYKKLLAKLEHDEKEAELDAHQHSIESGYTHF